MNKYSQFQFLVKSRRLTLPIWKKYFSTLQKPKLDDQDKYFVRQVRIAARQPEFHVTLTHKNTKTALTSIVKSKVNRKDLINKLLTKIKAERLERRKMRLTGREFDGAAYSLVGNVFQKPNQINEIGKHVRTNDPYAHKKPRLKNRNYIGVEVEFNEVRGVSMDDIAHALKTAGVGKYVNVTTDGSCGWEVRVLVPEDDYEKPLQTILKTIRDLGHRADHRCGTHIHFDMRNRDVKTVYANLFRTQKLLRKFLTKDRKRNRFCQMNKAESFDEQMSNGDRYYALNVQAYARHRTLEVRMHQGTLESDVLFPWIKLLLKIVNYKTAIPVKVNTLKQATKQFDIEPTLAQNLEKRILTLFRPGLPIGGVNV